MDRCAFDCDDRCSALTEKRCSKCGFKKTKAQLEEGRAKARKLLSEKYLPEQLVLIRRKYWSDGRVNF